MTYIHMRLVYVGVGCFKDVSIFIEFDTDVAEIHFIHNQNSYALN